MLWKPELSAGLISHYACKQTLTTNVSLGTSQNWDAFFFWGGGGGGGGGEVVEALSAAEFSLSIGNILLFLPA